MRESFIHSILFNSFLVALIEFESKINQLLEQQTPLVKHSLWLKK